MVAAPGTPDWWLERLYKQIRDRLPFVKEWDDWYSGEHPDPMGYEKAGPLLARILEATGLNMMSVVTDAPLDRMHLEGFKVGGKVNDDIWTIWQGNNFDRSAAQILQEKMALSASYGLVDPNPNAAGVPTMTPEHPLQCVTENYPGSTRRVAGLKVWLDDLGETPLLWAMLYLENEVHAYAAPTRVWAQQRNTMALRPVWEYQGTFSGANPLGEVPLVPFLNRPRMLKAPLPEFHPALPVQKRINKTLLDRMAMQDAGAFKAKWATGLQIPVDPATNQPVEPFAVAIDRLFVNENEKGSFGQFEAEDIKQMLEAVRDDVADCAMVVPTSPDAILGKLVNVSGDGLKLAQVSEIKRTRRHIKFDEESFEDLARLSLKAAGKDVPNVASMTTVWRNVEYRTEAEASDAATKAIGNGMPHEAAWERYYGATPDEIKDWNKKLDARATREAAVGVKAVRDAAASGN